MQIFVYISLKRTEHKILYKLRILFTSKKQFSELKMNDTFDATMDIFGEIEAHLNIQIPSQLRLMLKVNGYDSHHTIGTIDDSSIADIEKFARETLANVLSQDEYAAYYGIFQNKVTMYTVVSGYKRILLAIVNYYKKSCSFHLHNTMLTAKTISL